MSHFIWQCNNYLRIAPNIRCRKYLNI
ncbi:hypothetical protein ACHAXN_005623 [Cyclotella atomus]